jgi:hypothetical protein
VLQMQRKPSSDRVQSGFRTADGLDRRCRDCHCETSLAWKLSEAGAGAAAGLKHSGFERGIEMVKLRRARSNNINKYLNSKEIIIETHNIALSSSG